MKLSDTTLMILKNCSMFNQHIVIEAGNIIRTVSPKKTSLAMFEVDDTFPCEIALHDLSGFLKIVSLFEDPDFVFSEDQIEISGGGASQIYYTSEKRDLIYDTRTPNIPPIDVTFDITQDHLKKLLKGAMVNGVEDLAIVGEGGLIKLKALNKETPKRTFVVYTDATTDKNFCIYLKHSKKGSKLNLLPTDYTVSICSDRVVQFDFMLDDATLKYIYACERDSKFG